MIKYHLKRIWNWLRRMGYSRGFGVQSPSAYRFIRYVLTEHYPYYAYSELGKKHKVSGHEANKMGRLYFRLANDTQAESWYDYLSGSEVYADYVRSGCRTTVFEAMDSTSFPRHFRIARLSMTADYKAVYRRLVAVASNDSLLILEGINDNPGTKAFWHEVVESAEAVITYDLYACGIVQFDRSKYKHHYVVNF